MEKAEKFIIELPERKCTKFGDLKVENIDTRPKPNNALRNLFIVIVVLFLLFKLLKSKGNNKEKLGLFARLWKLVKGNKAV